jgi:transposase
MSKSFIVIDDSIVKQHSDTFKNEGKNMGKSFSLDLRKRVLEYLKTHSYSKTSDVFNVGKTTIYEWVQREKAGNLAPKTSINYPPRIVDIEKLKAYVFAHPDQTISEISGALAYGWETVRKWLKRLNITRKKKLRLTKKATKKLKKSF